MRILADDGTEFTTVEECKSYEEKQNKCEKCLFMINSNFKKTEYLNCDYLVAIETNDISLEDITEYIDDIYGGETSGTITDLDTLYKYMPDDMEVNWRSVSSLIKEYESKLEDLKSVMKYAEKMTCRCIY